MIAKIYQYNIFSREAHGGNPATVVELDKEIPEGEMLAFSKKNSDGVTSFVWLDNKKQYRIKWLSPFGNIHFCGHGALAAAFYLLQEKKVSSPQTIFGQFVSFIVQFNLENQPEIIFQAERDLELISPLNSELTFTDIIPIEIYKKGDFLLHVFGSENELARINVMHNELKKQKLYLAVTAPGSQSDYVLRYFTISAGPIEDAATGSVQKYLAPYWTQKLNKCDLIVHQLSQRGGWINVRYVQDRIHLSGPCWFLGIDTLC